MKFTITRNHLIKSLQRISGALSSRPVLPIVSNILLLVENDYLSITATDLEIELVAKLPLEHESEAGITTVPSRKFFDICRGLPDDAVISVTLESDRLVVRSGRSRFSLSTLPAKGFPNIADWESNIDVTLNQKQLRNLIEQTQFSMANNDVRYFLNGMLFDINGQILRSVTTDGHRMALSEAIMDEDHGTHQVIVPRKGVIELVKLLDNQEQPVKLQIGRSNIRVVVNDVVFTSKLIDGRFPDYHRVLPQASNKTLEANCELLRQAFSRTAILSNEKFRGVRVNVSTTEMCITANNPEQEEAEEILDVDFEGEDIEIGFNVTYVLDVLNALKCKKVRFLMTDTNASVLIQDVEQSQARYVVMPVRL